MDKGVRERERGTKNWRITFSPPISLNCGGLKKSTKIYKIYHHYGTQQEKILTPPFCRTAFSKKSQEKYQIESVMAH